MAEADAQKLADWYRAHIEAFREAYASMTTEELEALSHVSDAIDFRPPCQVEVFCMSGAHACEVVAVTHDQAREDGLVQVHGPWTGSDFVPGVVRVLSEDRWLAPVRGWFPGSEAPAARHLAHFLGTVRRTLQHLVFSQPPARRWGLSIPAGTGVFAHVIGSSLDGDPRSLAAEGVAYLRARQSAGHFATPIAAQSPRPRAHYFGAYYYSAIVLAEPRATESLEATILLDKPLLPPRRVVAVAPKARAIIHNDGLVLVSASSKEEAVQELNRVFAATLLAGIRCDAVRADEVHSFEVDADTYFIRSSQGLISSVRTTFGNSGHAPYSDPRVMAREVPLSFFQRVLDTVEQLRRNSDLDTESTFRLQADTFHLAGQYDQAFVLAWLILEKHVARTWDTFLRRQGVGGSRLSTLRQWSAHRQLEVLNVAGEFDAKSFDLLVSLKKARNAFIHGGKRVSAADARSAVDLAGRLVESLAMRTRFLQCLKAHEIRRRRAGET